jgi:hypothetical protein
MAILNMKTKAFRQGDVFKYPYLWFHQSAETNENPKDRPACLALKLEKMPGLTVLAILSISDQPNSDPAMSIEVPSQEIASSGLSEFRKAFIHLSEVNLDHQENSFSFNPNTKIMGQFSKKFIQTIGAQLALNMRAKRVTIIKRN